MKQVQFRNQIKGTRGYGTIMLKGIATDTEYFLYDTRNLNKILILTIQDFTTKSYKVEETTELTDKEVWILEEYAGCLTDFNYFKRRKDEFEAEILGLANNNEQLAVIDLLTSFETYANCKDEYEYTLKRVVELNKKLEEVEKSLITYLSERKTPKKLDFIELIQDKTDTKLVNNVLVLTFEGQVPLRDLAHLLSHNGVMFNTDGLLEVELKTEGNMNDINYKVEVFYNIVQPLTKRLTDELIAEFNDATNILKNLDNK